MAVAIKSGRGISPYGLSGNQATALTACSGDIA